MGSEMCIRDRDTKSDVKTYALCLFSVLTAWCTFISYQRNGEKAQRNVKYEESRNAARRGTCGQRGTKDRCHGSEGGISQ